VFPVGWFRMYVMEGPTPSHARWVRFGSDPGRLNNWPNFPVFQPLLGLQPDHYSCFLSDGMLKLENVPITTCLGISAAC
ncbi:hypothetical protein CC80DRAFT_415668, partial [Byssothecium circinans]